jgi:hypothetical protein
MSLPSGSTQAVEAVGVAMRACGDAGRVASCGVADELRAALFDRRRSLARAVTHALYGVPVVPATFLSLSRGTRPLVRVPHLPKGATSPSRTPRTAT